MPFIAHTLVSLADLKAYDLCPEVKKVKGWIDPPSSICFTDAKPNIYRMTILIDIKRFTQTSQVQKLSDKLSDGFILWIVNNKKLLSVLITEFTFFCTYQNEVMIKTEIDPVTQICIADSTLWY